MPIEFDGLNRLVLVTAPTTHVTALDIYSAAMDWCGEQLYMDDTVPMAAVGKFPLGGGASSDSIFLLVNGWKLKPWSGTYTLTVVGTLITDDESPRTVLPDYGNVTVVFQVSSQGIVVAGSGAGSGWDDPVSSHALPGSFGEFVQGKVLTVRKFLGLK